MKIIKGGIAVSAADSRVLDIGIEGDKIAMVAPEIAPGPGDELIDARGHLVFPGFIDAHTHFDLDAGTFATADDFSSGSRAALVGGTTTIVDFATQDRGGTLADALARWHGKAKGASSCDYAFHMAITDWSDATRAELDAMVGAGVTSFKLYMAYDALRVADDALLGVLREMRRIGGLVGVHCENGTIIDKLVRDELAAGHTGPDAHPRSRPAEAEAEAVNRLMYLSKLADWPACVVHLSTELGLNELKRAREMGVRAVAETCPQYLLLTDELYRSPGFEGAKYVCSPPLRSRADVDALRSAVEDGTIDTIATDHCSFNFVGQKDRGLADFSRIPNGLPGVEHRPMIIYTELVEGGPIEPEQMCALLSENPARLYGMYPRKGALLPGSDADIVIWERGIEHIITARDQIQNVDYTPYEGYVARGRARTVLLGGEVCADGGRIVRERRGKYVSRHGGEVATWRT